MNTIYFVPRKGLNNLVGERVTVFGLTGLIFPKLFVENVIYQILKRPTI
jgi:hypothetical protein